MNFEANRFNMFGIGGFLILVAAGAIVWYTNPELITTWLKKDSLQGEIKWVSGSPSKVTIKNNSDVEWKNVKVTLNKNSVSQRYEVSVPVPIKKNPKAFEIPISNFKKENGEVYADTMGEPHNITIDATFTETKPEGKTEDKTGRLEVQLGGKKI